jgi:hypothetical protein
MEVSGQLHTLSTLPLGKEPQEPAEEKAGANMHGLNKRKLSCTCQELKPNSSVVQSID